MMANHVLQKNHGQVCVKCGAIVRDNMPINYRKWKGIAHNPHVVPDSVNNFLWDEILKHFTLPQVVEPANVKRWTLARMTSVGAPDVSFTSHSATSK
jgi:hypothetical protein